MAKQIPGLTAGPVLFPKKEIDHLIRAIAAARYGKDDPAQLTLGEFYLLLLLEKIVNVSW